MERHARDFAVSVRRLREAPAFATIAVLLLALGVGVNSAVFGIVDPLLFRKLPVTDPDSLVLLHSVGTLRVNDVWQRSAVDGFASARASAVLGYSLVCRDSTSLSGTMFVRTVGGRADRLAPAVTRILQNVARDVQVTNVQTLAAYLRASFHPDRIVTTLLSLALASYLPVRRAMQVDPVDLNSQRPSPNAQSLPTTNPRRLTPWRLAVGNDWRLGLGNCGVENRPIVLARARAH